MGDEFKKIIDEQNAKAVEVTKLIEQQNQEIKSLGKSREETAKLLDEAGKKLIEIETEKKGLTDRLETLEAEMKRVPASLETREFKSAGQKFIESEEFKATEGGRIETGSVNIGSFFQKTVANSLRGDGDDRAPVFADRVAGFFAEEGERVLTIRDILNVIPTTSNAVEYMKETDDFEKGKAKSQANETAVKTQMKMAFEKVTTAVETISAWLPASRQVLSDSAGLAGYIDTRLRYKVEKEYEDQVLFGTGTSGNLLGIHNTDGVVTVGAPSSGQTQLDHIRRAIARVRVKEYFATAVILNPNDWAEIELLKGSDNRYVWVSVPDGGVQRLWRVPVVDTTAMEEGRFLTGAFGIGAQLHEREGATVRIAEQHSDYFVRNTVVLLGELRAALAVYKASAFCKGVFDSDLST